MKVRYVPQAREDIRNISDWIAQDSPLAAQRVEHDIRVAAMWLGSHPEVGVATDHSNIRRRPIPKMKYAIFYRIDWRTETLNVLRVVHSKQIRNLKHIPKPL
ncbi:MAG TPA: type II toxin-antitoxin system RelE/ParE family toxin [Candidatus Paceibacterota bacterium]